MINRITALLAALLLLFTFAPAASAHTTATPFGLPPFADPPARLGSCHLVTIPARLPTGQAVTLAAHDCAPRGRSPRTVLILVHGATYDSVARVLGMIESKPLG
jgi:hypothetical protein